MVYMLCYFVAFVSYKIKIVYIYVITLTAISVYFCPFGVKFTAEKLVKGCIF